MKFNWNGIENKTHTTNAEIDSCCWTLLKKMRLIDINSLKTSDVICTDDGILQPYNSVVHKEDEICYMVEYEVEYFDNAGMYNVHFWIYEEEKPHIQILETFILSPSDVDAMIRNEKLESIGI
jgi:hypothetical protein